MDVYYVHYAILDRRGVVIGPGGSIREQFVVPRSMDDIKRLSDRMTDEQRRQSAIGPSDWLSVMGWSKMDR